MGTGATIVRGYQLKTDANQLAISEAFKSLGCTVFDLSRVGFGMTDLIVGFCGLNLLVEAKSEIGKLTPDQVEFHASWRGHKCVIRTPDEAIDLVLQIRREIRNDEIRLNEKVKQFERYQEAEGIHNKVKKVISRGSKKVKP